MGKDERGFALLAVTIALAVLALIVGAVMVSSRNYVESSSKGLDSVRLKAALDAGVATAGNDLAGPAGPSLRFLAVPQSFLAGDVEVTIAARPESSKVDLSSADPKLIAALLRVLGLPQDKAEGYADKIADWRDKDGEARPHGAEASDYLAAGARQGPPNAPFATLSELSLLLGADKDLPACVEPDVTIFAGQGEVDLAQASDPVRRAVKIFEPDRAVPVLPAAAADSFFGPGASVYEVTVTARAAGRSLTRQVVMRITGSAHAPYWILSEQSPVPDAKDAAAACARLAQR